VLSHETILVHAQSVLQEPELIESSGRASAFDLWFAVLARAEAEGATVALVESVLEDHPGAESLRAALEVWQSACSALRLPDAGALPADGASQTEGTSQAPPSGHLAERLRWLVLVAGGLFLAGRLVYSRPEGEGARDIERAAEAKRVVAATARVQEALRPQAAPPTERELENELRACWSSTEGAAPQAPESSLSLHLVRGSGGGDSVEGLAPFSSVAPHFEACARAASARFLSRLQQGEQLSARLLLPGRAGSPLE
jgi:hypothetical protein